MMKGNLVFWGERRVGAVGEGAGWFLFLEGANAVLEKRCKKFALISCGKKRPVILRISLIVKRNIRHLLARSSNSFLGR
jgi:hypothetical protein